MLNKLSDILSKKTLILISFLMLVNPYVQGKELNRVPAFVDECKTAYKYYDPDTDALIRKEYIQCHFKIPDFKNDEIYRIHYKVVKEVEYYDKFGSIVRTEAFDVLDYNFEREILFGAVSDPNGEEVEIGKRVLYLKDGNYEKMEEFDLKIIENSDPEATYGTYQTIAKRIHWKENDKSFIEETGLTGDAHWFKAGKIIYTFNESNEKIRKHTFNSTTGYGAGDFEEQIEVYSGGESVPKDVFRKNQLPVEEHISIQENIRFHKCIEIMKGIKFLKVPEQSDSAWSREEFDWFYYKKFVVYPDMKVADHKITYPFLIHYYDLAPYNNEERKEFYIREILEKNNFKKFNKDGYLNGYHVLFKNSNQYLEFIRKAGITCAEEHYDKSYFSD